LRQLCKQQAQKIGEFWSLGAVRQIQINKQYQPKGVNGGKNMS
jgi:hypothetical protein